MGWKSNEIDDKKNRSIVKIVYCKAFAQISDDKTYNWSTNHQIKPYIKQSSGQNVMKRKRKKQRRPLYLHEHMNMCGICFVLPFFNRRDLMHLGEDEDGSKNRCRFSFSFRIFSLSLSLFLAQNRKNIVIERFVWAIGV